MKKHWILAALFSISTITAIGQTGAPVEGKKSKFSFAAIANVGLLEGEKGSDGQLQLINGLKYKSWFGGIGVGLDYYQFRSVPLFIDVRKHIIKGIPLSLYADAGIHFPWVKDGEMAGWYRTTFENGLYLDGGASYRFPVKKHALLLSAGYSVKKMEENRNTGLMCIWGDCPETLERLRYQLRRISIKAGWMF